jgi:ABC-type multidrug transport system ATPase subunit
VDKLLTEVNLLDVGNNAVRTFSGGMKRRMSVAISSIGNPKLIFMDEPVWIQFIIYD